MPPQVHPALLLLAEPVVVLVGGRVEKRRDPVCLVARCCAGDIGAFRGHGPRTHVKQGPPARSRHAHVVVVRRVGIRVSQKVFKAQFPVQCVERHSLHLLVNRASSRRDPDHKTRRSEDVGSLTVPLVRPTLRLRLRRNPISWGRDCSPFGRAHRHAYDVWCVGNEGDHPALALEDKRVVSRDCWGDKE